MPLMDEFGILLIASAVMWTISLRELRHRRYLSAAVLDALPLAGWMRFAALHSCNPPWPTWEIC